MKEKTKNSQEIILTRKKSLLLRKKNIKENLQINIS